MQIFAPAERVQQLTNNILEKRERITEHENGDMLTW